MLSNLYGHTIPFAIIIRSTDLVFFAFLTSSRARFGRLVLNEFKNYLWGVNQDLNAVVLGVSFVSFCQFFLCHVSEMIHSEQQFRG